MANGSGDSPFPPYPALILMKTRTILVAAMLTGSLGADPADDYVNWIRQTQEDSGVEWDVTVAPSGVSLSPEGVGPDGSNFELWSIHNLTAVEYLLDEQFVSSYLPTALIKITSADPYQAVTRTRVDQPYTVTITVAGLDDGSSGLAPEDIPDAAKKVALEHSVQAYDEVTHTLPDGAGNPTDLPGSYLESNGDAIIVYPVTNLSGPDLTQVEGEEVFSVSTLDDFGAPASVLDSKTIQIWPIATGLITGVDSAVRYVQLPDIFVTMHDLYPDSETYVRAYKGPPSASPVDPFMLSASYVKIADSVPQERDLMMDELDGVFTKEGPYTLELIHVTPFGIDILDQVHPLLVDRTIEVKMNLYSGE